MSTQDEVILELLKAHSTLVSDNPILQLGQKVIATEIENAASYLPYKIGDGVTAYNSLNFVSNSIMRSNTAADWTSDNPTPLLGEWCIETDTTSMKIGDGSTAWTSLPYRLSLTMIAEASRSASWILASGSSLTFADVDFGAYVPTGVKALLLKYQIGFTGNGSLDYGRAQLRENGSSITDVDQLVSVYIYREDETNGITIRQGGDVTVGCDADGIIEYLVEDAATDVWLNIIGYYI